MCPVVYLSKSELESFEASNVNECSGYMYEWEGEGVIHIHLAPLRHAFGLSSRIRFIKQDQLQQPIAAKEPLVVLLPDTEVKVFVVWEGDLIDVLIKCN